MAQNNTERYIMEEVDKLSDPIKTIVEVGALSSDRLNAEVFMKKRGYKGYICEANPYFWRELYDGTRYYDREILPFCITEREKEFVEFFCDKKEAYYGHSAVKDHHVNTSRDGEVVKVPSMSIQWLMTVVDGIGVMVIDTEGTTTRVANAMIDHGKAKPELLPQVLMVEEKDSDDVKFDPQGLYQRQQQIKNDKIYVKKK